MTAIRDELEQHGLTHSGAARLLGVDPRSVRRWADGTREMPEPVRRLLGLLKIPAVRRELEAATPQRPPAY
jgi:DNA-binding transcriptional regulator YiaG